MIRILSQLMKTQVNILHRSIMNQQETTKERTERVTMHWKIFVTKG